jgi:hypothetical protein
MIIGGDCSTERPLRWQDLSGFSRKLLSSIFYLLSVIFPVSPRGLHTNTLVISSAGITLTGATILANGAFRFNFANSPGASFQVVATTNLSLPASAWITLGFVTEVSPGQFQFTDPEAPNNPRRFYRVRLP